MRNGQARAGWVIKKPFFFFTEIVEIWINPSKYSIHNLDIELG